MTTLDSFLPYVLPQLPGCPEPLALQQLALAARDFCQQTRIFQVISGPTAVVAGEPTYALTLPPQTDMVAIERAWFGTRQLTLAPRADISSPLAYVPQAGTTTRSPGSPVAAYSTSSTTISLDPPPDKSEPLMLTARIAVMPTVGATEVDDSLFADWVEAIANGALYRIAMQPAQPYTNAEVASVAMRLFRHFISRARAEARVGRIQGDTRVQMRPLV